MDLAPLYLEPEPLSAIGSFIAFCIFMYFLGREKKEVDPDRKIIALLQGVFWFFGIFALALLLSLKANFVLQSFGYPPRVGELPSRPSNQEIVLHLLQTKREIERINFIVSSFMFLLLGCFIITYGGIARTLKLKKGQPEPREESTSPGIS